MFHTFKYWDNALLKVFALALIHLSYSLLAFRAHFGLPQRSTYRSSLHSLLYKQIIVHNPWALAFSVLICPLERLIFSIAFHLFLSVCDVNGHATRPPPSAYYSTCHTSFSLSLSTSLFPALSFPCSHMYDSPLYLWLSLPLSISSGVSAIKCKHGRAVSPTYTRNTGARTET